MYCVFLNNFEAFKFLINGNFKKLSFNNNWQRQTVTLYLPRPLRLRCMGNVSVPGLIGCVGHCTSSTVVRWALQSTKRRDITWHETAPEDDHIERREVLFFVSSNFYGLIKAKIQRLIFLMQRPRSLFCVHSQFFWITRSGVDNIVRKCCVE